MFWYATQGGGKAQYNDKKQLIFIEAPDCPDLKVGDMVPREWDIQGPFNEMGCRVDDFDNYFFGDAQD